MKKIQLNFEWTTKQEWAWPSNDVKLFEAIDNVLDIEEFMVHQPKRRTAIQAGGACGIWPHALAHCFEHVVTFEPLKENFDCLEENLEGVANVTYYFAAIGDGTEPGGKVSMVQQPGEKQNNGSFQVEIKGDGTVPVMKIDPLQLENVDLICLDLEGYEFQALKGARETIEKYRPLIAMENKRHSAKYGVPHGTAARWLDENFGYEVMYKNRRDIVLRAKEGN